MPYRVPPTQFLISVVEKVTENKKTKIIVICFKIGICQGLYCHPVYLTCIQSTSWEMLDWEKNKLESRLSGEISITSDMQMTPPLWQKVKRTKKPLDEGESGEWKSWLKDQHSENEDHGIRSHHFMGNRWGNSGNSVRLYFSGLPNHCRWWLQPWN